MSMLGKAFSISRKSLGKFASFGAVAGIGGLFAAKNTVLSTLKTGTALTSPITPTVGQRKMYGKRGIDANRGNTENLTQNLYRNRRKF